MRKMVRNILVLICSFCMIFLLQNMDVNAAMQDEAMDYDLGEVYAGTVSYSESYFKFTLTQKSHVSFVTTLSDKSKYDIEYMNINIYNASGKKVFNNIDIQSNYSLNSATGVWTSSLSRNLAAGTYYVEYTTGGANYKYTFRVQAEKHIKLPKGRINSLKSKRKGQMEVKCKKVSEALGYRIQYATDYRFKKGVKTLYSPTENKTIKGLKKGKIYYVKICPYTVYDDGDYVFGQNSYVKKVVIKK